MRSIAVWMITYNHENYIAKAIEGVLSQTMLPHLLLVVSVDLCDDKTLEIVKKYQKGNGDVIRIIDRANRVGYQENFISALEEIQKDFDFIAMCEGDDYWCDPLKLEKQKSILEKNSECVMSFHDGISIDDNDNNLGFFSEGRMKKGHEAGYINTDIILKSPLRMIHLSSIFFRPRGIDFSFLREYFYDAPVLDTPLINIIAGYGEVHYCPDKMFVQRNHNDSITNSRKFDFRYYLQVKRMLNNVITIIPRYKNEIQCAIKGRYFSFLMNCYSNSNKFEKISLSIKMLIYVKYTNYTVGDLFYLLRKKW